MKKLLVFVLILSLALGCSAAMAADAACPHNNTSEYMSGLVYEPWSDQNHQVLYEIDVFCDDCGEWIDWYGEGYFDQHSIEVDGQCIYCSYSTSSTPTPEALQREALERITKNPDDIIGKTALVIHKGSLHANAAASSASAGKVNTDEEYDIVDYAVDGDEVWLEIRYGLGTAWISAGQVKISGANALNSEYADFYLGRTCTIKVSSGRARAAADKDSPVLGYVGYGERYTILACKAASDGTLWFQIRVDNAECWISSGLADVN